MPSATSSSAARHDDVIVDELEQSTATSRRHHEQLQQHPATTTGSDVVTGRYKTELCRSWQESGGVCRYGDKCQFAHGLEELRCVDRHPRYKTELCRTFHSRGFCAYGPRCHFIHNGDELSTTTTTTVEQLSSVRQMLEVHQRLLQLSRQLSDQSLPTSSTMSTMSTTLLPIATPPTLNTSSVRRPSAPALVGSSRSSTGQATSCSRWKDSTDWSEYRSRSMSLSASAVNSADLLCNTTFTTCSNSNLSSWSSSPCSGLALDPSRNMSSVGSSHRSSPTSLSPQSSVDLLASHYTPQSAGSQLPSSSLLGFDSQWSVTDEAIVPLDVIAGVTLRAW